MRKLDLSGIRSKLLSTLDLYGMTRHYQRAETIFNCYDDDMITYDELVEDLRLIVMVAICELAFDMRRSYSNSALGDADALRTASVFGKRIKAISVLL